jgi:hypothetical protein
MKRHPTPQMPYSRWLTAQGLTPSVIDEAGLPDGYIGVVLDCIEPASAALGLAVWLVMSYPHIGLDEVFEYIHDDT